MNITASIACLGNIGPGLASVEPMGNFAELPAISREILIFDMYAGRLEVVTVFIISVVVSGVFQGEEMELRNYNA